MQKFRYIILGAGPAGLSFAHTLKSMGEESFLVIDQNATAGGLCRSEIVDGSPLDIGGGHFLDVTRHEVLDLLFRFMPRSEWREFKRVTTIRIRGTEISYPLEANLWQLPVDDRLDFLESIARAGCMRGEPMPESFEQWISWKLGRCIADEYMLPYNRKIWSIDLNELGTYWLGKLPDVSFRQTLKSCLEGRAQGSVPAHGVFLYPKEYGYGEVWERMGRALDDRLLLSTPVDSVDVTTRTVNGDLCADRIISTIPWTVWPRFGCVPERIRADIAELQYSSIDVDYHSESPGTTAHWVYDPDESVAHHRVLCRSNFCAGSRGYWTETNGARSHQSAGWRYSNAFAYPLNTRVKPRAIRNTLEWARQHDITGLGRWGTWEHMNSDVAVSAAIRAATQLVEGTRSV